MSATVLLFALSSVFFYTLAYLFIERGLGLELFFLSSAFDGKLLVYLIMADASARFGLLVLFPFSSSFLEGETEFGIELVYFYMVGIELV